MTNTSVSAPRPTSPLISGLRRSSLGMSCHLKSSKVELLTLNNDKRTPAGAAHIAFPAPSKEAVNTFFISALKAGGTIHGEPKCRDTETGYFSAAVVDFDGNSIEAVYRPDPATTTTARSEAGSVARSERTTTRGPSALQTIKNGSVVSRARSVRTTEDRAVQAAIENIPPSRVKMLDQQAPTTYQQQQQAYAPAQQSSDGSISAKTIIGTLLGATAGAALAYAMIKGDSSSNSSSPPQSSVPVPAPAPSQYVQQPQQQQQQPQQLLQQQPHQMSMSLPMLMPMLGPAPGYQEQQQQPVYRALEAPPTVLAPSQAARSVYTANDAISAYTRSTAPKSKSPRADTIYEETEYYPPITEGSVPPRSLYSQEASTINGGGSSGGGVRRTSNGSVYATRDLPIRAIEYGMSAVSSSQHSQSHSEKGRSKSYPCDPSTFISSYAETRQQQQQQQGHIIGETESDFSSISTIKPVAKSVASSHRSSATVKSSSKHSTHQDLDARGTSVASSNRSAAHKVALPDSRPGSTYTSASKASKRSSASTIKDLQRRDRESSLVDAYEIPLPASAAPSTVFLDAVVDITPEDSISQVGISSYHHHSDNNKSSSSGRSHRSRSGPSSQSQAPSIPAASSKRDKDVAETGSKFDQPLKPSDSISQVSSNHRHSSASHHGSHHSHHSHSHGGGGGHRGSSKVSTSERSASGKKSHSGSVRSGHY